MDALVIGQGRIGTALLERLKADGVSAVGTSLAVGPFTVAQDTPAPITFFCAGVNGFKPCDEDPRTAAWINVVRTLDLANERARQGNVVFLSSSAAVNNRDRVYGALKLVTEQGFLNLGEKACILRFGPIIRNGGEYANGKFPPQPLDKVVGILAGLVKAWRPGLYEVLD